MPKLEEVLTQLSDLDPEADYSVDVSENNISVKCNTDEDTSVLSEEIKQLQDKVTEQSSQIDKLKLTNRALLLKTPVAEEPKTPEEIIYAICGPKKGNGANA